VENDANAAEADATPDEPADGITGDTPTAE
jgi:hypothetical protein